MKLTSRSVSSVKTLEDVKTDPSCLYLSMPVQVRYACLTRGVYLTDHDEQEFDTLGGFKRFTDLLAVGVKTGREALKTWKEEGRLPTGLVDDVKGAPAIQRGNRLRRVSSVQSRLNIAKRYPRSRMSI